MGVRAAEAVDRLPRPAPAGPGAWRSLVVFVAAWAWLLANARPIGDADASGAASWLWKGAQALAGSGVALDGAGASIVGKLLAAAAAATAATAVFAAVARRHPLCEARWAGLVLVTATTLVASAQAWSGEAAATAAVAIALLLMVRGEVEDEGGVASRAGLPLALAAFLEPASAALALVLASAVLLRWRRPALLAWAVAGALPSLLATLAAARRSPAQASSLPDPATAAALLISPAKGVLVFAPVAVVGLVGLAAAWRSAGRRGRWDEPRSRMLPVACALGVAAQLVTVAVLGGWDSGVFWGPRLLAPAWPLLMLFLPEGLAASGVVGTALVVVSVAVQAMGAFSYDGRWDRLHRDARGGLGSAAWDLARSPIAFQWREGALRLSLLGLDGRRLVVREHALVRGSLAGSFVSFGEGAVRATGADATLVAVRLEQGARVAGHRLELTAPGDGIAFRVREGARARRLELRIAGQGQGTLAVGEAGFWTGARWRERSVAGPFKLRLAYAFAETGAGDLSVVLRSGGPLALDSVALVPPGDPEHVYRLP